MTPFDIDGFLQGSFIVRVATNGPEGPSIRPVLYLWEDGAFWWVTSSYAHELFRLLELDPRVALVVDAYDPTTGFVRKVTAAGVAEVLPLDRDRAVRCASRVLGDDPESWDPESRSLVFEDENARLVRVRPTRLVAHDLSYEPPPSVRRPAQEAV
jgi:nitroimidazol reductase NimA-like FMN-containing flavoprotein (pyridoxamine 5'-phosphate oxidase superfamily)